MKEMKTDRFKRASPDGGPKRLLHQVERALRERFERGC